MFLHRVGFAGQQRLVDEEVLGLEQTAICRDQIASRQQHHVARHQLRDRDLLRLAVAQHRGPHRDSLFQLIRGAPGAVFLKEIQRYAHQHDGPDDHEAGDLAGHRGDSAGRQQNHHQRIFEVAQVLDEQRPFAMIPQRVGAELRAARPRFPLAQPGPGRLQL